MMNICILNGRLTKDIEVRYTKNETAVGNFTLAVNRDYKNTEGQYETDFINCTLYGQIAEKMKVWTQKGDLIGITGRIQTSNYEDKEGNKKYKTEIIVEKITLLQNSKKKQPEEENQYKNMNIKTESQQQFKITEQDLPF